MFLRFRSQHIMVWSNAGVEFRKPVLGQSGTVFELQIRIIKSQFLQLKLMTIHFEMYVIGSYCNLISGQVQARLPEVSNLV